MTVKLNKEQSLTFENIDLKLTMLKTKENQLNNSWNDTLSEVCRDNGKQLEDVLQVDYITGQIIFRESDQQPHPEAQEHSTKNKE